MQIPKRNKGAHTEPEIGKDNPTQGGKPSTGCVALYLLVRKCSRPKAHIYMPKQGSKYVPYSSLG